MMNVLRRLATLILTSIMSAGMIVLLILVTTMLTQDSITPASILPAERTIALYMHPSPDAIATVQQEYSLDHTFHTTSDIEAIAIVKGDDNATHSVTFYKDVVDNSPQTMVEYGPFMIVVSDAAAHSAIGEHADPLHKHQNYHALAGFMTPDEEWVYTKSTPTSEDILHSIVTSHVTDMAWSSDQGGQYLMKQHKKGTAKNSLTTTVLPSPHIVLTDQQLQQWWNNRPEGTQRDLLDAHAGYAVSAAFGNHISFQFDILPLLNNATMLELKETASGNTVFALRGSADDKEQLEDTMLALHASFRGTRVPIVKQEHQFNDTFGLVTLRADEQPGDDGIDRKNMGGWNVQTSYNHSGTPLHTATRNKHFILSNAEGFDPTVEHSWLTGNTDDVIAAGEIAPSISTTAFQPTLDSLGMFSDTNMFNYSDERGFSWVREQVDSIDILKIFE